MKLVGYIYNKNRPAAKPTYPHKKETGRSLIECKKALRTTDDDINKAIKLLKNYQPHVMIYHPPIVGNDVDDDI